MNRRSLVLALVCSLGLIPFFWMLVFPGEQIRVEKPDWVAQTAPTPAATKELQVALASSERETALADMQPPAQLATAFVEAAVPMSFMVEAPIDPAVARDLSNALLIATDKLWLSRAYAEATGERTVLSDFATYWLVIWPDLARLILEGRVERRVETIEQSSKPGTQRPKFCFLNTLGDNVLTARVDSDQWSVVFTIRKDGRTPAPEFFELVLEDQTRRRKEKERR